MTKPLYRLHIREPDGAVQVSSALRGAEAARKLAWALLEIGNAAIIRCEGVSCDDLPVEDLLRDGGPTKV